MQNNDTNEMLGMLIAIRDNLLKPMSDEIQNEINKTLSICDLIRNELNDISAANQSSVSLINETSKESTKNIKNDVQKNYDQIKEIQLTLEDNKQKDSQCSENISQIKYDLELMTSSLSAQFKKVFLLFYILLFSVLSGIILFACFFI